MMQKGVFPPVQVGQQIPLQTIVIHVLHIPFAQAILDGQTWPQVPQLLLSMSTSVQIPSHSVVPSEHTHVPFTQAASGGQWWPQLPQLLGSLLVSIQVEPQAVKPPEQVHWQLLESKVCPSGQVGETQWSPQSTVPMGQVQVKVLGSQ